MAKPSRLSTVSPGCDASCLGNPRAQPISPPVGEMPGRARGRPRYDIRDVSTFPCRRLAADTICN
ncbi:hypothetical protein EFD56_28970 [Rhizobium phaseoli]|nr:hypothetical protein EFD56_28970 [Rhizobium phaseoli]